MIRASKPYALPTPLDQNEHAALPLTGQASLVVIVCFIIQGR